MTDTQDTSFFNETQEFLDTQYVTGRDILVAPIFQPKSAVPDESRDVYLPIGYSWYPSNLRPWDSDALKASLLPAVEGGSVINFVAKIPEDENAYEQYAYVLPVYIREGMGHASVNEFMLNRNCRCYHSATTGATMGA